MNSNYEAIFSLIELLVKKAGFDVTKDYSEVELAKTKETINNLSKKKTTASNKKTVSSIIESLKLRQATLENNAEIVGKSLLEAYKQEKSYENVRARIELLGNLALEGTSDVTVSSVYTKLKTLENDYKKLKHKIDTYDYSNKEEKEMDERYKTYLQNKIKSLASELESVDNELNNLKEVLVKDENIVNELKEYINKLNSDKDKVNKASTMAIKSSVNYDVWERLETIKTRTHEKLDRANELLKKTENMLEEVKKTKASLNERKNTLAAEKQRCTNKLNTITNKLNDDKYENSPEKMIDINNSEIMKLEINSLSNKKDVVYVDALKVKEELIKAWTSTKFSQSVILENLESTSGSVNTIKVNEVSSEEKSVNEEKNESVNEKMPIETDFEEIKVEEKDDDVLDKQMSKLEKIEEDFKEIIDKSSNFRDNIVDNTSREDVSIMPEVKEEKQDLKIEPHIDIDSETEEVINQITEALNDESKVEVKEEKKNKMELDW